MSAVQCLLFGFFLLLCCVHSEALRCHTCIGSTDEDCNHQGAKECPRYSDACAIIKGEGSGVLKSCSYKSFCSQAHSQGDRVAGVKVHCCYSDDCNAMGRGIRLSRGFSPLLVLVPLFWHYLSS